MSTNPACQLSAGFFCPAFFTSRQDVFLEYRRPRRYSKTARSRNPKASDGGTAFRPVNGRAYFDNLR